MNNRWINVEKKNLKDGLNILVRDDLIKIIIEGEKIQTKISFMDQIGQALQFPATCAGKFSRFEDMIQDLDWLPTEKGICIWITNYEDFMQGDIRSKGIIEEIFKEEVLPFWEAEVTKRVKGGEPKEFYVIVS